ncbi:hypothetical protein QR680_014643 [Steinernema hermaphroditum]|uniref:Uncharacterized protein n=1 Tax=Steinernema hermaphroditum TaxID=289476 RepID=A0AA39IBX8_9BILA|nr:hypothetical protein QR680_014643 [Steinernema hermaphroditum]
MLFGSDPFARINVSEPLCIFLVSSIRTDLSNFTFASVFWNGTCQSTKASEFTHVNASIFSGAVSYGMYCFDDATESILLDRNDLYNGLGPLSTRLRDTIFLFLRKKGACENGNVYYQVLLDGQSKIGASSDCPAVILTATGTFQMDGLSFRGNTNCPLNVMSSFYSSPNNLRVDVTTVQNGLRHLENNEILSYVSSNPPADGTEFLRSAIMITPNSTDWTWLMQLETENADQGGSVTCLLNQHLNEKSSGLIESDPYGPEEFNYTFTFSYDNPQMTISIEAYDKECVDLTFIRTHHDGTQSKTSNPRDTLVLVDFEDIIVVFHRKDPVKCASHGVTIRYTLSDAPPANPTDAPLPDSCTPPSPGAAIDPDLPFMLFGKDNVSHIILNEPVCLFVHSNDRVNMSTFTITAVYKNGSCSSVGWGELQNTEKYCFDDSTTMLMLNRGSIFDGLREGSMEWRSSLFLFLAKAKLQGDCEDGNVVKLNVLSKISASADCPAFVLFLAGDDYMIPICPAWGFDCEANALPSNVEVDLYTVQNGLNPVINPHIEKYTHHRQPPSEIFLRNAVMVTSNSTGKRIRLEASVFVSYGTTPQRCTLYNTISGDLTTLMSSDPYGVEEFDYVVMASTTHDRITVDIEPYSDLCTELIFVSTNQNQSNSSLTNPHGSVFFSNFVQVVIMFSRKTHIGCSRYSAINMRLSGVSGVTTTTSSTVTATPVGSSVPTTTQKTTALSSAPFVTTAVNGLTSVQQETTTSMSRTTTTRSTDSCTPPSPGAAIDPDLPFMLFGKDNVSHIILNEPVCLFVHSNNRVNMSTFTITAVYKNGSCSSVGWGELHNTEKYCFDDSTTMLMLNRGSIFDGLREGSMEWRSSLFLFLAKAKLQGDCEDGNVVKLNVLSKISASADCPAFVLFLAGDDYMIPICPAWGFDCEANALPSNVEVDLYTVQNGLNPVINPHIEKYTHHRQPPSEIFLRNAVMVTSNSTGKRIRLEASVFVSYGTTPQRCTLYNTISGDLTTLMSSDPYGVEEFDYVVMASTTHDRITVDIEPYSDLCTELIFVSTNQNQSNSSLTNPHGSVFFSNFVQVVIMFSRKTHIGCSRYSPINMRLSGVSGVTSTTSSTATATPVGSSVLSTTQKTSALSSAPFVTTAANSLTPVQQETAASISGTTATRSTGVAGVTSTTSSTVTATPVGSSVLSITQKTTALTGDNNVHIRNNGYWKHRFVEQQRECSSFDD